MKTLFIKTVREALAEDKARQDITSRAFIPAQKRSTAVIVAKEPATVCGITAAQVAFKSLDPNIYFHAHVIDGRHVAKGAKIATIKGKARTILEGERVAINFLGYLSGIATQTSAYAAQTRGTKAKIFDTRKTTPTLRAMEKYAVRCGGGVNHRMNLADMAMIKDNHLAALKNIKELPSKVKAFRKKTKKKIEIEVDHLSQLPYVLAARPDMILLDNMTVKQIRKAVSVIRSSKFRPIPSIEASGGIAFKDVHAVAKTGVDRISIGALTHTRRSIDFSLEIS